MSSKIAARLLGLKSQNSWGVSPHVTAVQQATVMSSCQTASIKDNPLWLNQIYGCGQQSARLMPSAPLAPAVDDGQGLHTAKCAANGLRQALGLLGDADLPGAQRRS